MIKYIIKIVCIFLSFSVNVNANQINEMDTGTYELLTAQGQPIGMKIRLSSKNNKWLMEGKNSSNIWKDLSCGKDCELKESSYDSSLVYLSKFPQYISRKSNISCIQNIAAAFCRVVPNNVAKDKWVYGYIALVTGVPVLIPLRRID
jgi:hypothetical protein